MVGFAIFIFVVVGDFHFLLLAIGREKEGVSRVSRLHNPTWLVDGGTFVATTNRNHHKIKIIN
jgi:hypothetical protein